MPAPSDPRVQFAIRRACEKRARKRNRQAVAVALERAGAASLRELVELTSLDRHECGAALDELKVRLQVVEEHGLFCWASEVERIPQ